MRAADAGSFPSPPSWTNCRPTSRHLLIPAPRPPAPGAASLPRPAPPGTHSGRGFLLVSVAYPLRLLPPQTGTDAPTPLAPRSALALSPPPGLSPPPSLPQPPSLPPARPAPPPPPPPSPPPRLLRVSPAGKSPRTPSLPPPRGEGRPAPRCAARPGRAPGAHRLPAARGQRSAPPPRRLPNALGFGVGRCVLGASADRARAQVLL